MAEARIGGERRCFVEDRFPHHGLHLVTYRVVALLEVMADFRVRRLREALCAKRLVREERRKFEEREAVCGEHVERISEKFIGPCAEVVQSQRASAPARIPHYARNSPLLLQGIQTAENSLSAARCRSAFMKFTPECYLMRGDDAEEKGRSIAVQIKIQNAAARFDVLLGQEPKQRAFTVPVFPSTAMCVVRRVVLRLTRSRVTISSTT